MSELKIVPLQSITMINNYRDVEPPSEKDADVKELADSINKYGVMQPVLLRPDPKKKDAYQMIFGHRRLLASRVAKKESIPANIKEVLDDDVLELQVTENLQRKDVHPMDEAIAFKSIKDNKKYSVEEIAARFAKKPEYIVLRMKLNDLIPEAQKRFRNKGSDMLLGHAILLARLQPEDQKAMMKYGMGTVKDISDHIERNILRDLSKASFDIKDANLFPQAGACTTCPKRSGYSPLLFPDEKNPNRCFDKNCFTTKSSTSFIKTLKEIIETKPEIVIVRERYSDVPKSAVEFLEKMNVKIVTSDNFSNGTYKGSDYTLKTKAFYLNGYDAGKIKDIYLKGGKKASDGSKDSSVSNTILISGIKERLARSKVLDQCKVHSQIIDALKDNKSLDPMKGSFKFQDVDRGIMAWILLKHAGLDSDTIKGVPDQPDSDKPEYKIEYFKKLSKITDESLALIIRLVVMDKYASQNLNYGVDVDDTPVKIIADYLGVDTKAISMAQQEAADKREARAKQRIVALGKPATKKKSVNIKHKTKAAKKK